MAELLQLVVSGIATGAIYALAALGFTLLWQAAGVINFAQGEFVMLPAFSMLVLLAHGAPLWVAFLVTCAIAALALGAGFKRMTLPAHAQDCHARSEGVHFGARTAREAPIEIGE